MCICMYVCMRVHTYVRAYTNFFLLAFPAVGLVENILHTLLVPLYSVIISVMVMIESCSKFLRKKNFET